MVYQFPNVIYNFNIEFHKTNDEIVIRFQENVSIGVQNEILNNFSDIIEYDFDQDDEETNHIKEFNESKKRMRWVKIATQHTVEDVIGMLSPIEEIEFAYPVYYRNDLPYPVGFAYNPQIRIVLKQGVDDDSLDALYSEYGLKVHRSHGRWRLVVINFDSNYDISTIIGALNNSVYVEAAMPDLIQLNYFSNSIPPGDQHYGNQWYLNNDTNPEHDINIEDAWMVSRGSPLVVIAVIDDGFDLDHEDLEPQLVQTEKIKNLTGSSSFPEETHGTSVAGIASAHTDSPDDIGIAGVGWRCRIMPIAFGETLTSSSLIDGLVWARNNKAKIVNISHRIFTDSCETGADIKNEINYCVNNNMVIVAAAGSFGASEVFPPACYPGVISVGATDKDDVKWTWSNTSSRGEISVVAPGVEIYTTKPSNTYDYFGGTSAASPQVAGLAGLILAKDPTLTPQQVKDLIETTADNTIDPGCPNWVSWYGNGRIDAGKCLAELDTDPPSFTPVDVFIRDYLGDSGAVPSTESVICWSPDIVLRDHGDPRPIDLNNKDVDPGSVAVTPGNDYDIYLRVHNKTGSDTDVHARVYYAPLTTSCSPDLWRYIGQLDIYDVPANGFKASEPLTWTNVQAPSGPSEHFCLIASIEGYGDPHPDTSDIDTAAAYLNFIRNNNNVCYRNLVIVEAIPDEPVSLTFIVKGFPMGGNNFDLRLLQRADGNINAVFYDFQTKKVMPNNDGFEPHTFIDDRYRVTRESAIHLDRNEIKVYQLRLLVESGMRRRGPLAILQVYEGRVIGTIIVEVA